MRISSLSVTFHGEGRFYIGDPCYILDDVCYNTWLDEIDANNSCGIMTPSDFDGEGAFAICRTANGDGMYEGKRTGNKYCVDSGTIGLIESSLWKENFNKDAGTIVNVKNYISFYYIDGVFSIETDCETKFKDFIDTNY